MLSASQYTSLQALVNCPGPAGAQGDPGPRGSTGSEGPRGSTGTNGGRGATGDPGPGSEISPTFTVRALTTDPWFEWSVSGTDNWSSTDVGIVYGSTGQALDSNTEIRGITFNGTLWVCSVFVKTASSTVYPQFLYSSTGKIWTASTSFPFGQANEVRGAYNIGWNGRTFVATGTSGDVSVVYSTDNGITWTPVANSRANIMQIGRSIAWNGKAWLLTGKPAVGTDLIAYSLNGVSWTPVSTAAAEFSEGYSLATDGKLWVVGGNKVDNNDIPIWSESLTGDTGWQTVSGWASVGFADGNYVSDISWNGRQWIALVYTDTNSVQSLLVSTNGKAWVSKRTGVQLQKAISVTWNSYSWIVTGESIINNQRLIYSTDNGEIWTPIDSDTIETSTSITSRTVTGSFYSVVPYINVKDFGAIGDGTINDTVSINSAISYAEKYTNGARVIVPAGTYKYEPLVDGIPNRIEFVQETGARLVDRDTGVPITVTSTSTSIRSRIIKNDDESNGLSSYNGVTMNGIYTTGGGLGNNDTRSVANMFDVNPDRRQIGKPISIKISSSAPVSNVFNITASNGTLPLVKIGNAIKFETTMGGTGGIQAGTVYYIRSATVSSPNVSISLSISTLLDPIFPVSTVTLDVAGTVYDSTDTYGSTLSGRSILSSQNVPIGGRIGVEGRIEQTEATPLANLNNRYIGVSGISTTSSGDNGTDTTDNTRGEYFGGKFGASLVTNTATNVNSVIGGQFDVSVTNNTMSSKYIFGAASVGSLGPLNPDTEVAAAYGIGSTASTNGWLHGILFSDANGSDPLRLDDSTVLGHYWKNTPSTRRTILNGIDLSGFEMKGNVIASPRLTIKDVSGSLPTIGTASGRSLILEAGGTGDVQFKSGSTRLSVTNLGTTFIGNLYGGLLSSGSSGNSDLLLQSGGTGSVKISSTGSGGVSLLSNTTLADGKTFTQGGTGTFSTGTGDVSLNGNVIIADNKTFTQGGTGTFSTGSGAVQLNGDTTITGSKTFTTGSGAVQLNGDTTITGSKTFTTGTGLVQLNGDTTITGSKTFTTGTGLVQLNGNTTLTTGRSLTFASGSTGTFSTGEGLVSLRGNVVIADNKTFTQGGTGTFSTGTGGVFLNGTTLLSMSSGFGYKLPAGGLPTVTQGSTGTTPRENDVKFDNSTGFPGGVHAGRIFIPAGNAPIGGVFTFNLYNACIETDDMVIVTQQSSGTGINNATIFHVGAHVNTQIDGRAEISVRNLSNSVQTSSIPLRFLIIKFT